MYTPTITLKNGLRKKYVQKKLKNALVRVRVELTTLALSAPRSADWANGPAMFKEVEFLVLIIEFSRSLRLI